MLKPWRRRGPPGAVLLELAVSVVAACLLAHVLLLRCSSKNATPACVASLLSRSCSGR